MSSREPPRLRIPKRSAATEITQLRAEASRLLSESSSVSDQDSADSWRFAFERWRSSAREFLLNSYTTADHADAFFAKARRPGRAVVGRVAWRDRHTRLVENLKEAENELASLEERLDRVPLAGSEFVDSAIMTHRLRRPPAEVESIIDRAIERAEKLLETAEDVRDAASFEAWVHETERWHALTREGLAVSYESPEPHEEFYSAATGRIFRQMGQSADEEFRYRQEATRNAINTLRSLRERLEYAEEPFTPAREPAPAVRAVGGGVFLVHGHDEAAKQTVARFIEKVTKPGVTILEEQPDRGRTLIEKFEDHAGEMGYAVVLLTGDDEGRKAADGDLTPRARQNVVLELGFFIGALGRDRVAMLYKEGVELPSDIAGVLYLAMDTGDAWKIKLAREMRAAGVPVDADAVLGS